jgi:hypothetical protein
MTERGHWRGQAGYPSGDTPVTQMPPPKTGIKRTGRCLTCGHDRDQHPPNHFAMFGWHCKVIGCSCGQFQGVESQVEQADPLDLAVDAAKQDLAAVPAEPADLQQAIQAAYEALSDLESDIFSPHDAARVAVEAAWPLLEGKLRAAQADMRGVIQQREAAYEVVHDLEGKLRAAQAEVDRLKTVLDVAIWDEDWRGNRSCRACYELRPDHDQPCPIAAALDRGTGPDQHPKSGGDQGYDDDLSDTLADDPDDDDGDALHQRIFGGGPDAD